MAKTATDPLQAAISKDLDARIEDINERIAELEGLRADNEYARTQLHRIDPAKSRFTVSINDRTVSMYSHGAHKAEEEYTLTGLFAAVKSAEKQFASRHGSIRTDGGVRYRVVVHVGNMSFDVPHQLWVEASCQSPASLAKGDRY